MGDFDGIEKATGGNEKLPPIQPGRYVLEVEKLMMIDTLKIGRVFVGEYKVLKSEGPNASPTGSRVSHLVKKKPGQVGTEMFLNNIKPLVAAIKGVPMTKVTGKLSDEVMENTPIGTRLAAEAYQIMIGQNKDKPFTKVNYAPVAANGKAT